MALEHAEMQAIKKEILEEADERYVKVSDCNKKTETVNKRFANDDKRIDLMLAEIKQMRKEHKEGLKLNNWLTAGVFAAIIAAVVAFYFFTT